MSDVLFEQDADSSPETRGENVALPPPPGPAYWLVPDHEGKPANIGAIPIYSADYLNTVLMPVMPMYDLKVSAALIPMGDKGLGEHLRKFKARYPARYRRVQRNGLQKRIRLLSAAEIQAIREEIFLGPGRRTKYPLPLV